MAGPELRRSARVSAAFLVAVDGVDEDLLPRRGDISATGMYFESDRPVGAAGTVQFVTIAAPDRRRTIDVMAHVVRTVTLEEAKRRLYGVALEFMPATEEAAADIERFVQYLLLVVDDADAAVHPRLDATTGGGGAILKQLSVRAMTLETTFPVPPGEKLRVDITAPNLARRVRLEGSAVRVRSAEQRYEIEVEFEAEVERRLSSQRMAAVGPEAIEAALRAKKEPPLAEVDDVAQALDDLFAGLIHAPKATPPRREHLSGVIARIRLATLCALCDMERLTGELALRRDDESTIVFVRDGHLVDVFPVAEGQSPRERLRELLRWERGSFELTLKEVERPDRIAVGTTALLLDLAREDDEARR